MNASAVLNAPVEAVRSSVNAPAFFAAIKHMFASSTSYLGELMQNARRAGASQVSFDFDPKAGKLTVRDDGEGVRDFEALIRLCESDWSQQVTLTDKPFGMGLFSVFHAADSVRVRSGGQMLDITLEDIVHSRVLRLQPDPDGPAQGTVLELSGMREAGKTSPYMPLGNGDDDLGQYAVTQQLQQFAEGFEIPVILNGQALTRPAAVSNLTGGRQTPIGYVWIEVLDGSAPGLKSFDLNRGQYLQGLPIGTVGPTKWLQTPAVVHLDSTRFVARMPDRSDLFDAREQERVIDEGVKAYARQRLSEIKAQIQDLSSPDGARFVERYFSLAHRADCIELLDDIPWLPESLLEGVRDIDLGELSACVGAIGAFGDPRLVHGCLPMSAFEHGAVTLGNPGKTHPLWRHLPDSTFDTPWSSLLLNAASALGARQIDARLLSPGHWACRLGRDANRLRLEIEPKNPRGAEAFHLDGKDYVLRAVDGISVRLRDEDDPSYAEQASLDFAATPLFDADGQAGTAGQWNNDYDNDDVDGALNVGVVRDKPEMPARAPTQAETKPLAVLYVDAKSCCTGDALRQLCSFMDEDERIDDGWFDGVITEWDSLLNKITGATLAQQAALLLGDSMNVDLSREQLQQVGLLAATPRGRIVSLDLFGPDGLSRLCTSLARSGVQGATPDKLLAAIKRVSGREMKKQFPGDFPVRTTASPSPAHTRRAVDEEAGEEPGAVQRQRA